jgi:hypothetical protein
MLKTRIKRWLRSVEFRLYTAGALVSSYSWVDPTTALMIYNAMPTFLQIIVPKKILVPVGGLIFFAAVLTSFAKKKMRRRRGEHE